MTEISESRRSRVLDLHNEGACLRTIEMLTGVDASNASKLIRSSGAATPRGKPKRGRWEWAFARAGWPRYEDARIKQTDAVGRVWR